MFFGREDAYTNKIYLKKRKRRRISQYTLLLKDSFGVTVTDKFTRELLSEKKKISLKWTESIDEIWWNVLTFIIIIITHRHTFHLFRLFYFLFLNFLSKLRKMIEALMHRNGMQTSLFSSQMNWVLIKTIWWLFFN